MLSRQNLPMPLLRVVLQFLSLAVSVMDILVISRDGSSQKATQKRLISEISLFSLVFKRRATGEKAPSSAHRESAKSALFL